VNSLKKYLYNVSQVIKYEVSFYYERVSSLNYLIELIVLKFSFVHYP